jgi:hypothetical protein
MKLKAALVTVTFALTVSVGNAQTSKSKYGLESGKTPQVEVPLYFQLIHANAPPGDCGCFWMAGGGGGLVYNINRHWGAVADFVGAHASNISGGSEDLTIFNYQFGPRYSYRNHTRFTPYGQALLGGSNVSSNNAVYGSGTNVFSSTVGGGFSVRLSDHFAVIPLEAGWMFSQAPNNDNDRQNNLKLSFVLVLRFAGR